jgi:hypothetical protein
VSLADDLRRAALQVVLRENAAARLLADDEGSTVAESRTKPADDFAAALLLLWERLQRGQIDADEYTAQVERLFDKAVGTVPDAGQETIERLKAQALARAQAFVDKIDVDPEDEDAPSGAQKHNWASMVAGAVWGAVLAAGAYREEKERVTWHLDGDAPDGRNCEDCLDLDGQSWPLKDVPQWPGDGSTDCGGNCRCDCY